jgi:hypothetical protein
MVALYAATAVIVSGIIIFFMYREIGIGIPRFLSHLMPGATASVAGLCVVWSINRWHIDSLPDWIASAAAYVLAVVASFLATRTQLLACFIALKGAISAGTEQLNQTKIARI